MSDWCGATLMAVAPATTCRPQLTSVEANATSRGIGNEKCSCVQNGRLVGNTEVPRTRFSTTAKLPMSAKLC
jgi:hypothetical protein